MGRLHQYGGQLCGGTQSRWEGASHLLELGGRGEVVTGERAEAGVLPPPERLPQQVHNWVRQVLSHYRPLDAGKSTIISKTTFIIIIPATKSKRGIIVLSLWSNQRYTT